MGRVLHRGLRRGDDGLPGRHRLRHVGTRRSARSTRRCTACTAPTSGPPTQRSPASCRPSSCRCSPTTARSCRPCSRRAIRRSLAPSREPSHEPALEPSSSCSAGCVARPGASARLAPCCSRPAALLALGCPARLVGDARQRRPHRRRPQRVPQEAPGQHRDRHRARVLVAATDHRWVRILAPLVYAGSIVGLVLVLAMGSTINGSRSWILLGPACPSSPRSSPSSP